jgi:uncharacterized protein YbaR (Trm112 family)
MQPEDLKFTPGAADAPRPAQMPGGQPQQLNIDASTLETFVCPNCKNHLFQNLVVIKRVSPINPANTTGKEMFAPMQVLSCTNCGQVPDEFGGKAVPQGPESESSE